ncbi:hypothetical protein HELRODRAFT_189633 [Helobdella robusta]|uniref:Cns1/TTC4 wheel domain-containing protein n=1 Tax=Helobdella robusta TaxID=6412 RepID=T1FR80_HELRO|nr:hypothetical protein HELRODRAFT_189633 [Helobdella robusta]ESN92960.1 hypothetical protein HELRODRAFT_189633 [Helobdella robusta]
MENLAKQLEDDLESFIAQKILESKNSPRSFNFDNKSVDEIAEEMKQHPAFMTEFDESKPMSPAMEALQVLKYESQSCDASVVEQEMVNSKTNEVILKQAYYSSTAPVTTNVSEIIMLMEKYIFGRGTSTIGGNLKESSDIRRTDQNRSSLYLNLRATNTVPSTPHDVHPHNATSYKDDGNKNFERKKYRWAIDNYTAGLNCHPTDSKLITVLYTNRAAANFHIGNYRSSLNDCMSALKITNDHKKAWIRAVDCLMKLEKYKEVVDWSGKALMKELERNKRKQNKVDAQLKSKQLKIIRTLQRKGIILYKESRKDKSILVETKNDDDWLDVIKQSHNGSCIEMVEKDENSTCAGISHEVELLFPVMFLYPEYNQSDFIMSFHEHSKFEEHLEAMFGPCCDPPSWDEQKLYLPSKLQVYFEERDLNDESSVKLHAVPHDWSLLNVLQCGNRHPNFVDTATDLAHPVKVCLDPPPNKTDANIDTSVFTEASASAYMDIFCKQGCLNGTSVIYRYTITIIGKLTVHRNLWCFGFVNNPVPISSINVGTGTDHRPPQNPIFNTFEKLKCGDIQQVTQGLHEYYSLLIAISFPCNLSSSC